MRGTIHVVAQSHIDVAWLWRYDPETIYRCCRPTFTLAADNIGRYPDYAFSQSQVPLYQAVEEIFPKLFEKVRRYVEEGRWEIVGGSYVEFEGGEPCGESLIRQCVMGKRYFAEKFNIDVKTGWQVDAWSHPWQLPQILNKCGIDSYMFKRGERGERLFWWQSPDGSRVLAYKPLHENATCSWESFFSQVSRRYGIKDAMVIIGRGDHGGGPTSEEIKAVKKFASEVSSEMEVKFSTFRNFVETIIPRKNDLPVINNELNFELVGDLTNCGELKRKNRFCENLLLTTEKFCSIASILFEHHYPEEEIYESWKKVLFNQFHDIIGGSGIPSVCRDAIRFYEIVEESSRKLLCDSLSSILMNVNTEGQGESVVVLNPLPWERTDLVEVELALTKEFNGIQLLDENGNQVPVQITDKRKDDERCFLRFIFVAENIPSLGYRRYQLVGVKEEARYSNPISATELRIGNEFFEVDIDPDTGCLRSIFDKENGTEVLDSSRRGNALVAIEDIGDSEGRFVKGSDTIAKPPGKARDISPHPSIGLCETGPVRAKLRVKKEFHNSTFVQDIMIYPKMRRVDFDLVVDWHDIHWMIKVAFPFNIENPRVTYDTAYGTIDRPADGLEYPAQKWVDLSSSGYGVALLNNGRYGHDVEGNVIRMSVLRSPTEPAHNTDEGVHEVGYSICPHSGTWREANIMRKGYEFNYPLIAFVEGSHPGSLPPVFSFMKVRPENVIVEVLKKAYGADDFILRAYETHGRNCTAEIAMAWGIASAYEADLMESKIGEVNFDGDVLKIQMKAHEIKTIKLHLK